MASSSVSSHYTYEKFVFVSVKYRQFSFYVTNTTTNSDKNLSAFSPDRKQTALNCKIILHKSANRCY